MSDVYAEIMEQIGRVKPVTVKTVVEGREGLLADGMHRTMSEGVIPVTDPKGRSFARVTAEYDGETLTVCEPVMPKERLLAFMPRMDMYKEFIENGIGIIRLWEQWLGEITPDMVHAAGAEQVWIMCWTKEKGMDGTPESLDRLTKLNADGALISDVKMAMEWMNH